MMSFGKGDEGVWESNFTMVGVEICYPNTFANGTFGTCRLFPFQYLY